MMSPVVCFFLTAWIVSALGAEHSLFYTYMSLSKPLNLPGIYDFIAMGTLDDQMIDYYDSQTQVRVPKQDWMREKMPADYWKNGTQSRRSKEQSLKSMLNVLMERMGHNKYTLHVLQWRHGCVINEDLDGRITFLRGISEYSYDGTEFLYFDDVNSRWIAPVPEAEPTKKKWNEDGILNQNIKAYLEKECVDWLFKFMEYGEEELRKHSPPYVRVFAKKSVTDFSKLTLTCMATGFYPKDVEMNIRLRTSLPEHLVTSSGIRFNGDGTYQLRKSVEITEEEKDLYDCFVYHNTLNEPKITQLNHKCNNCTPNKVESDTSGAIIGVLVMLALVGAVVCFLLRKATFSNRRRNGRSRQTTNCTVFL